MAAALTPTKRARAASAPDDDRLRIKVRGTEDRTQRHDVTMYTWWDSHEGSATTHSHTFETKRHALLYVAKRNCEELNTYITESGQRWADLFPADSVYALEPNAPFDLATLAELSDDQIEAYGNGVCDAFSRKKVGKGISYRYAPRVSDEMGEEALMKILKRDKPGKEELEHHKRQAFLLSDIAGFD